MFVSLIDDVKLTSYPDMINPLKAGVLRKQKNHGNKG